MNANDLVRSVLEIQEKVSALRQIVDICSAPMALPEQRCENQGDTWCESCKQRFCFDHVTIGEVDLCHECYNSVKEEVAP